MRKNRVKVSQTKPKKSSNDHRPDAKISQGSKGEVEISDSFSDLDIPSEPEFRPPTGIRNYHSNAESPEELSIKVLPVAMGEEKDSPIRQSAFENSLSGFESSPVNNKEDYSELDSSQPKELISQIKELQLELQEMNQRINFTEEEMKSKEIEAQELKELLIKLRENQVMILESNETKSNCKACNLF